MDNKSHISTETAPMKEPYENERANSNGYQNAECRRLEEKEIDLELARLRIQELEMSIELERLKQSSSSKSSAPNEHPVTSLIKRPCCQPDLPKRELTKFNGDPKEYWAFINEFQGMVEDKTDDNGLKLSHLLQYCVGPAKAAIRHCTVLPTQEGYDAAKGILRRRFGQNYMVARAYIDPLLDGSPLTDGNTEALLQLAQDLRICEATLTQLQYSSDMNSSRTIETVVKRLPSRLRHQWADVAASIIREDREPDFTDLTQFVENRSEVASTRFGKLASVVKADVNKYHPATRTSVETRRSVNSMQSFESNGDHSTFHQRCPMCSESHVSNQCPVLREKSVSERFALVRERKVCIVCLKPNHIAKQCKSPVGCTVEGCGRRHHRLLHREYDEPQQSTSLHAITPQVQRPIRRPNVALAVIPVLVRNGCKTLETCAFLDNGSDSSFILDRLAKDLGLNGKPSSLSVATINGNSTCQALEVSFELLSIESGASVPVAHAWTISHLPSLSRAIPNEEQLQRWPHLADIPLTSCNADEVTILLGTDVPDAHWIIDKRRGSPGQPFAIQTVLGWTIVGPLNPMSGSLTTVNFSHAMEIERSLKLFYEQDMIDVGPIRDKEMSVEDHRALSVMKSSIHLKDGHYEVALPWRFSTVHMPSNKNFALQRLMMLKRRLLRSEHLRQQYTEVMADYIKQGYAEPVKDQLNAVSLWYLPHHPVFHPMKPDKPRIVFDCAAKYHGVSLNESLLSGPDLNNSLIGVLLRFRQDKVAVVSDVKAMFHQVRVPIKDRDALRFFWWPHGELDSVPQEYRMCVHLFGATSSPSCSTFALIQTINDNQHLFDSDVVTRAKRSFYVDDCLLSVTCASDARRHATQLRAMLASGGFNLTKWVSNALNALETIPDVDHAISSVDFGDLREETIMRTLGLSWDVKRDTYNFRSKPMRAEFTRRSILSYVASFFDPLGLISPVILVAKLVLQGLCKRKLSWDDTIDGEEYQMWVKWLDVLPFIEHLSIPRCLRGPGFEECHTFNLHVFCDASESAYGAVAYLLLINSDGMKMCRLVFSKSRVSPLSRTSIPKLELGGAVIASKLARMLKTELEVTIAKTTYWTDSLIVLQSIRNETKRFPTFFANRLSVIHQLSDTSEWRYVDTKRNPADYLSRGLLANQTEQLNYWINGPAFLLLDEKEWPQNPTDALLTTSVQAHVCVEGSKVCGHDSLLLKFSSVSSWEKLQRLFAWLLRFKDYITKRQREFSSYLSTGELKRASKEIVKLTQQDVFQHELKVLKENLGSTCSDRPTSKQKLNAISSPLRKLRPIVQDYMLRVGGRLHQSQLPDDAKHPVILPSNHFVTRLIIDHHHKINGHMGSTFVLAAVRQKYWIIRSAKTIKSVLNKCFKCRRWYGSPCNQMMAPLPADRLQAFENPFDVTGVDYFGPLYVKRARSIEKRYGCLFTCFASRAVHIELAHSLDTDSFLCAFTRFVARRGCPTRLYSDNGTNFKGAESEIKRLLVQWNQEKIHTSLASRDCQWIFLPPKASHRGGLWERIIRTIKRILLLILEEQPVNDEVLQTTLIEIERILNDRPLVKQLDDPDDLYVLTPHKLLLLRSNAPIPVSNTVTETRFTRRWHQAQYLADQFWRKWVKDYLPTLQLSQKWNKAEPNLRVGEIVLLIDTGLPRGRWPKAVVQETHEGSDGLVRTATLRTASGVVQRDIRNICRLEGALTSDIEESASVQ